ncbi:Spo0E family sporulation regulatory protein-aspartic acid phosphatase [Clostridium senegalense]
MGKIEDMQKIILVMRQELQDLINEKSDLLHPEVIAASQKLDQALNDYNDILKELKK